MKIGFTLKPKDGNIEDFEKQIEDLEKIGAGSAEIPLYELDVVCGKKIIKDELKLLNKFTLKSNLKFSIHGSMSVNLLRIHQEKGAMLTAANMHVAKKSMSTLFRNACCIIDMHVA